MKPNMLYCSIIAFVLLCCNSCGSYYYSEGYFFNVSSDKLISEINQFIEKYPEYKCTQVNEKGESYSKGRFYGYSEKGESIYSRTRTDSSIFYSFYFHFPDINADIHCVINVSKQVPETTFSILQLTGVTFSSNWASWKTINNNKEIDKKENQMIKKKFETEILDRISDGKWKHRH